MFPWVPLIAWRQKEGESNRLLSSRGKRKPRPVMTVGVCAVDASEEAPPQAWGQPRIARGPLSNPSRRRGGRSSESFSSPSPLSAMPHGFLRVPGLRTRSALLRAGVPQAVSRGEVPRIQPALSEKPQGPAAPCRPTNPLPTATIAIAGAGAAAAAAGEKSDGSLSCLCAQSWQSRHRTTS